MSFDVQTKLVKLVKNKKLLGLFLILSSVLVWGLLNSKFSFDKYDPTFDMRGHYDINSVFVAQSVFDYHQFPLWSPYVYGGTPFYQYPQNPVFTISNALLLITRSFNAAFNLLGMIQLLIIGITIYLLLIEMDLDYKYALVGAFSFMFSRLNIGAVTSGGELHFDSLVWLPATFLFIYRAYKRKEWVKSSIFAGISLALAFHVGDVSIFTYMLFFIALLFAYLILTSPRKYMKIIMIFFILAVVLLGLSAIRLLPLLDFSKVSDLSGGRSFEAARGQLYLKSDGPLDLVSKVVNALIGNGNFNGVPDSQIGLITFLLALLSLFLIKKRYVLFFVISILVISNVATGSYLFYLLWKIFPGFDKQHHIGRIMYLIPFCFSVLAGFGSSFLFKNVLGGLKNKKLTSIAFFVFLAVLFLGFPYKSPNLSFQRVSMDEQMYSNPLMVYLSNESRQELFRVHEWGLFNIIGGGHSYFWIPMKISTAHGHWNTFEAEYLLQFMNPVASSNPTKILGMYNTKYFYLNETINSPDLVLAKEFEGCNLSVQPSICTDANSGPYLYLNKKYVPRAYIVDNAILIVAEKQKAVQFMYFLVSNRNFNPANLAVIPGDINDLSKYDVDFLLRFSSVIILDKPSEGIAILEQYADRGGKLMPNIFRGEVALSQEGIDLLLSNYSSGYDQIKKTDITDYKPNSMKVSLNNDSGFIVIAEKYFMYEGWHANDNRPILRTNGVSSGVWVNRGDSELEFSYFPKSFKIGMAITLITLLGISFYFVFVSIKKRHLPKSIKTD